MLDLPDFNYHGRHGSKSDKVLMLQYPKISIPDKYRSNQYVFFKAEGEFGSYGIHLIYFEDHQRNDSFSSFLIPKIMKTTICHLSNLPENSDENTSTSQHLKRRRDDGEHNNQAEEPHHRIYMREPNTDLKL